MTSWQPIETAPKDGTEILLYYEDWLGHEHMVVSGYWDTEEVDQKDEATWCHSRGYGDADMWTPLPLPPDAT